MSESPSPSSRLDPEALFERWLKLAEGLNRGGGQSSLQADTMAYLSALPTEASELERLREALKIADEALTDARDGLDFGLGCARDVEDDCGPRASAPRSVRQEAHLDRARKAHQAIRAALSPKPGAEG